MYSGSQIQIPIESNELLIGSIDLPKHGRSRGLHHPSKVFFAVDLRHGLGMLHAAWQDDRHQ